jgi:hypothetical protein
MIMNMIIAKVINAVAESVDSMTAVYVFISGEAGEARDWGRQLLS